MRGAVPSPRVTVISVRSPVRRVNANRLPSGDQAPIWTPFRNPRATTRGRRPSERAMTSSSRVPARRRYARRLPVGDQPGRLPWAMRRGRRPSAFAIVISLPPLSKATYASRCPDGAQLAQQPRRTESRSPVCASTTWRRRVVPSQSVSTRMIRAPSNDHDPPDQQESRRFQGLESSVCHASEPSALSTARIHSSGSSRLNSPARTRTWPAGDQLAFSPPVMRVARPSTGTSRVYHEAHFV
jgi:hypothetical protein